MNNQIVTPAADNVARVSIAGYHSIISLVYDKANSTLSNSLNSVVYFQTANVDSLVSSGNVTGGNISTAGNISGNGLALFGQVHIGGSLNYAEDANLIVVENKNSFADIIAQNKNSGGNASMNIVLVNDDPGNVYMAVGVNSSNFTPFYNTLFEIPNAGYVSHSTTQIMGPQSAESGESRMFFTYSSGSYALELNEHGAIGWGASYNGNLTQGNFGNVGQVLTSAGENSAPSWTNIPAPTVSQDITSNGAMSIMTYDGNLKYVNNATVEPSTGNIAGGNISTTGQITSTKAGNLSNGGGQLYLNGSGNNRIDFNTNGTGAPTFTTRSAGAKVVLYPVIDGTSTDYALGVDSGTFWSGIPAADAGIFFKWYAGTTEVANLSGTGILTVTGNITGGNLVTGGNLSVTGNANIGNLGTTTAIITTGNITTINSGLLQNGNSNITITSNGNVSIQAAGSTVELVVTSTGANITGTANITGNANVANIGATDGVFTGNISGNTNGFTIGYLNIPQVSASNTTLALTDAGKHYYSTSAGNFTLTVPNNTSVSFATGTAISIVVQSAGNVLVNAASGVTLYMAGNSTAANRVVSNYGMATLMKVATDTWMISGSGVA
jgi:hypothetical protein